MTAACLVGLALAVALSWVLASRLPEHRPIARLLAALLAIDLANLAVQSTLVASLREAHPDGAPWTGWARVGGIAADAVWLLGPAAIAGGALVLFGGRRPWWAAAGWGGFVAALLVADRERVLWAAQVAMVAACAGLFAAWCGREKKAVTSSHYGMAMILAIEATSLFAAWRAGPFQHWDLTQGLYLALVGGLVLLTGGYLWTPQHSS